RITTSVVQQYFYPILRGDLIVEVIDGKRIQRIAADTIDNLSTSDHAVARLCALTRWSLEQRDNAPMVLPEPGLSAPKWDESMLEAAQLAALRDRFSSGARLAFRAPILVKRKRARAASSSFDIYIEQDETLRMSDHH